MEDSLICQEDNSCLNNQEGKMGNQSYWDYECEDNYIQLLVDKEIKHKNSGPDCSVTSPKYPSWLSIARLDGINWIINAQTHLGFRNRTAYLSVLYFDRFLSKRFIDEDNLWAIRLLSIACFLLAAKLEECTFDTFSDFPVQEDYSFSTQVIQKMELLVLSTLDWRMRLITPFDYIRYFVEKLGDQEARFHELITRAKELLMAVTKEINTVDHRPSVIAAAAVSAAVDCQLTKEALVIKISTVPLWDVLKVEEELFTCYSLMQRLCYKGNPSTPNFNEAGDQTLCATTSTVGSKRRLTFSDNDPNDDSPDKVQRR